MYVQGGFSIDELDCLYVCDYWVIKLGGYIVSHYYFTFIFGRTGNSDDPQIKATEKELNQKMLDHKNSLRDMEDVLPHKNG